MSNSKFAIKLNTIRTQFFIRYSELFEGVGDQLIARLASPSNNNNNHNFQKQPPIDSSTFKKLAGCITMVYVLLIAILSISLLIAYTCFPEERLHHTNLIFLIIICALIFGICLVSFCIYAKVYKVTGEIRAYSPSFNNNGDLSGMDSLGSVAYGRTVKINITNHPGNNFEGSNSRSYLENIPTWNNNYSDLQDDAPDYGEIRKQQGVNRANLQFLKHID